MVDQSNEAAGSSRRSSRVVRWIDHRLPVFTFVNHELNDYPTPRNLNYLWNFGSLAGFMLVVMIFTGIVLAMHYTADSTLAFGSVEHIMRDLNYGWMIRYIHLNGASFFFIATYIHIFRGLYYGSYKAPRELLWMLGIVILLLMMATAFFGYVLPWSQMGFWGATVITNLFSAIPVVGESIVTWLWGGFSVDNPTLQRFYALHYLLPFVIVGVVMLHLVALHRHGSNNPLGIDRNGPGDSIPFHPYYTVKDLLGLAAFLLVFAFFVFYLPNYLNSTDAFIPANPLRTPAEVVPQWYFLPFYAILRSIPNKLAGVIAMFSAVAVLFILPWLDTSKVRSARFRPIYKWIFWLLVIDVIVLGWVGANKPEGLFVLIGRVGTFYYFFHFLVVMPLLGIFERPLPLPTSIVSAVLPKGGSHPAAAQVLADTPQPIQPSSTAPVSSGTATAKPTQMPKLTAD
ncbi:cytochrome b N-terminal domain-containing protein [Mesorhizobium sp. M0166]|uniref:cytochrome b n=1 Tax=Mesorhizobium sp. M0166 TaxID=2956902 RepID=UPI003336CF71